MLTNTAQSSSFLLDIILVYISNGFLSFNTFSITSIVSQKLAIANSIPNQYASYEIDTYQSYSSLMSSNCHDKLHICLALNPSLRETVSSASLFFFFFFVISIVFLYSASFVDK